MENKKTIWAATAVAGLVLCGLAMGVLPGGDALLPLRQVLAQYEAYEISFPMAAAPNVYVASPASPNTTFLPVRVEPDTPAEPPSRVDFTMDGPGPPEAFGTDDEMPFIGHWDDINEDVGVSLTIIGDAFGGVPEALVNVVTRDIDVLGLPDDDANGIPEDTGGANDPFAVVTPGVWVGQVPSADEASSEVVYTAVGSVGLDTMALTGEVSLVMTGSDVTLAIPTDALPAPDPDGRVIVRTSASPGDIDTVLGSLLLPSTTPAPVFEVAPVVAIDAHLVDSAAAEVDSPDAPLVVRVPVDIIPAGFTDEIGKIGIPIFFAETDLDMDYNVLVPAGAAFEQLAVEQDVEFNELVFDIDGLTTYVPLFHEGAPIIEALTGELSGPKSGCTPVTIDGAGYLDSDIVVEFGGNAATDVNVAYNTGELTGTITCVTPPGDALGPVEVRITNLDVGGGGFDIFALLEDAYTYTLSTPVITGIVPSSGRRGTRWVITGTGFDSDALVTFDGVLVADAVVSVNCGAGAGQTHLITGTVPAGAGPGLVTVLVLNVESDTSDATTFLILAGAAVGGGRGGSGGPCFVVTATYGSSMAEQLEVLRTFRDRYLLTNAAGTALMKAYYNYSPAVAKAIAGSSALRAMTRVVLTPIVALARLMLVTPLWVKLALASIAVAAVALVRRRVRA